MSNILKYNRTTVGFSFNILVHFGEVKSRVKASFENGCGVERSMISFAEVVKVKGRVG